MGSTKDALLTVDVEENAPAVELSGRISQLTRDGGLPIWVNLANVLYVENVKLVDCSDGLPPRGQVFRSNS